MKSSIITSESPLKRYPLLAFVLSFLFSGLGQIYCGDFSKGIVYFILRNFSLIFIPLYVIIQNNFSIIFAIAALSIHILVWFISSAGAARSASGKNAYNLKKYNSILFYFFYIMISSMFLILSAILVISVFSVNKIQTDDMNPLLLKNDYVLINKYAVDNLGIGDMVLYASRNELIAGRVIAVDPDMIGRKGNDYYINDTVLPHGIISKPELEKMGIKNSEDLFFEINGEKKYPVKIKSVKNKNVPAIGPFTINRGELFVAFDNRVSRDFYEIINRNSILGRIDGIVFSKEPERIFKIISLHFY
jgi:signal peptidase I